MQPPYSSDSTAQHMSSMMASGRRRVLIHLRPRRLSHQRNLLASLAAAFTVTTLLLIVLMLSSLPASSTPPSRHGINAGSTTPRDPPAHCGAMSASLGEFGDMMVSMLPRDLAFTAFVPSPETFRGVLKLRPNHSAAGSKPSDDTYAVVSRVLGFSAVPRRLRSEDVPLRGAARLLDMDSVSGLKMRAWRDVDGALVVNGLRSECVDVVRGEIVVHVMAGVLMDAEFERFFSL